MNLLHLKVNNFKRFQHAEIEFSPGLNVIKGPNESGKSTLLQAILAALYWNPSSTRQEIRFCTSWGGEGGFSVSIKASSEDGEWTLTKDFSSKSTRLEKENGVISDIRRVEEWVADETGLPSEQSFRLTAGVHQDEVASIGGGKGELARRLQVMVTGGAEGVSALEVIDSMEKARAEILKGVERPAKNPGPLASVLGRLRSLEEEKAGVEEKVRALCQARQKCKEIKIELEELEDEIAVLEKMREDFRARMVLDEELREIREEYAGLRRILELWEERDKVQQERRERYGGVEDLLRERGELLGCLELRRAGLQEGVRHLQEEFAKARKTASLGVTRPSPLLLVAAILLALGGLVGMAFKVYLVGVAVPGILLLVYYLVRFFRQPPEESPAIQALSEQVGSMQRELSTVEGQMEEIIASTGIFSIDDFTEAKLALLELLEKERELTNKLEVLAAGKKREDIEGKLEEMALESGIKEQQYKLLGKGFSDLVECERAQRRLERLKEGVENLRKEKLRWELFIERCDVDEEQLITLEEEGAHYLRERENWMRRSEAYALAIQWLRQASEKMMREIREGVEKEVGSMISIITGGRYDRVEIADDDFNLVVYSKEKGDRVPVSQLSRGTIDQIYLCARFALVKLICGEKKPPIILDDPFVTFDSERIGRSLGLLKEFSSEYQVILFTCTDNYDVYADRVIKLVPA